MTIAALACVCNRGVWRGVGGSEDDAADDGGQEERGDGRGVVWLEKEEEEDENNDACMLVSWWCVFGLMCGKEGRACPKPCCCWEATQAHSNSCPS